MHEVTGEKSPPNSGRSTLRKLARFCFLGCGAFTALGFALVVLGFFLLSKVPKNYPPVASPLPAPDKGIPAGDGLAGFDSPYIGHTGSWNGKGGTMTGAPKDADLDIEKKMGLKWTFMAAYWRALEPHGPVNLDVQLPDAWRQLDRFVIAAKSRGLNVLMQAPVIGGNAQGPPAWAGRREEGRSAPADMEAAALFAAKLANRYRPGGSLATAQGWGETFGIRAWELDNEPESYRTHWKNQAGDYAEFATKVSAAIKAADPKALIVLPGAAGGPGATPWLEAALNPSSNAGSPAFQRNGKRYSIGPLADIVSFHNYEGLETAFAGSDRTVESDFSSVREVFEKWQTRSNGFYYQPKHDYWHTEGNFDFFGILSAERRAAWRFQFFTRGFAAGIRKLAVMDASRAEQTAVAAYVKALPNPFPMVRATSEIAIPEGQAVAFRHDDAPGEGAGRVWVIWAVAGTGPAVAEVPVRRGSPTKVGGEGLEERLTSVGNRVRIHLRGDPKMAPGILLIDR